MKAFSRLFSGAAVLALAGVIGLTPAAKADEEWEESTPYYEDDAWYDVSEWFDGNDYNPTDEVVGRWDDETYEAWQDTGSDTDNDWGFYDNDVADNDWFYDYYDYDYDYGYDYGLDDEDEGLYNYTYRYYDWDDDNFYDAYTAYYDWDNDGVYEDVDYFSFNDVGTQTANQQQAQSESKSAPSSKAFTVTGTIQRTKTATVGGAKHTVALLKQEKSGNDVAVDLGRQDQLKDLNLESGKEIRVRGPMAKIGDKPIVMAQTVAMGGESFAIDRNRQSRRGEIVDTREVQLRGQKHLLAIIRGERNQDQRLAVDLGAADRLDADPKKGDRIVVTGVPVKVQGKQLLMAQSFTLDGDRFTIARNKAESDAATAARAGQQGERR